MGPFRFSSLKNVVAIGVLLLKFAGISVAQNQTCAQDLLPCADYLNSTATPPSSCCNPIKQVVATQLDCLCNLFNTPGLLQSLGVNITQVLHVTKACGVSADPSVCKSVAPSPQEPARPTPAPGSNNSGGIMWPGSSALLLFWACAIFHWA